MHCVLTSVHQCWLAGASLREVVVATLGGSGLVIKLTSAEHHTLCKYYSQAMHSTDQSPVIMSMSRRISSWT